MRRSIDGPRRLRRVEVHANRPLLVRVGKRRQILPSPMRPCLIAGRSVNRAVKCVYRCSLCTCRGRLGRKFVAIRKNREIKITKGMVVRGRGMGGVRCVSSLGMEVSRRMLKYTSTLVPCVARGGRVYRALVVSPPYYKGAALVHSLVHRVSSKGRCVGKYSINIMSRESRLNKYCLKVTRGRLNAEASVLSYYPGTRKVVVLVHSVTPHMVTISRVNADRSVRTVRCTVRYNYQLVTDMRDLSVSRTSGGPVLNSLVHEEVFRHCIILKRSRNPNGVQRVCSRQKHILYEG